MKTSKLNALIGGSPSVTAPFTPAINNILGKGTGKKMPAMPKMPMKKAPMKQYGDKGYKPADGSGTGM